MACDCGHADDWTAVLDKTPPDKPRLRVQGTADCSTTGYTKVRLEEQKPQGINERVLLLELKWTAPEGVVGQMITPHQLRYQKTGSPEYDEVEIVNCGNKRIKVEVVQ